MDKEGNSKLFKRKGVISMISPTPWTQYTRDGKLNIADKRGLNIANDVIMRDDAKLIVEAVNSYAANQATIESQANQIQTLESQVKHEQQFCKQMVKLKCACRTAFDCKCTNNAVGCKPYCADPIAK
jgi:hypothetical protein